MIFDERDLDEEITEEDKKKSHKPHKDQLDLGDMLNSKNVILSSKKNKEKLVISKSKTTNKKQEKEIIVDNDSHLEKDEEILQKDIESENKNDDNDIIGNSNKSENKTSVVRERTFEETITIDNDGNYLKDIAQIYHDSMIPYSEYVILDRAIPRVEDGLKPVQRRILYSMYELGVTPDKPYKKSAKTVGDVIANYHPHGDSSIYNAMVHLAQKFNMREILVDGHGNFGSVDGDGAAAMRYTEARLAPLALEMLRDIDKNTVRWAKNYDDSKDEPEMLPSRFPNILVNGATGIAVGLATNIPPHNLGECIDACAMLIDNPKACLDDLIKVIKGPDFPTGGLIIGEEGIRQAFETGKGKIIVRAKTHIEEEKGDKKTIVITEFPYQVNKSQVLLKIAELKEKYKDILSGIADVRDESDRQGVRAVVCLKKDTDAEAILNFLLKYTDLQTSIGVNMVVIADGKPRQLGLMSILRYYINYQQQVVLNRTKYDLEDAEARANILEGLLIAIQNIDEVIRIIKTSASTVEAKHSLCKTFNLNERQAQAILDMRLARLTNLEVYKLEEELTALKKLIKELTAIVKSPKLQMGIVKKEMLEIKKKFANKRLTTIITDGSKFNIEDKIENLKPVKDIYIAINEKNCIKKMPEKSFMSSAKSVTNNSSLNEVHTNILKTKTDCSLLLFTKMGYCYKLEQDNILEARWKDRGSILQELLSNYDPNDKVLYMLDYKNMLPKSDIVLITNLGNIKRISLSEFDLKKQEISILKLKEGEFIVSIEKFEKDKTMLFITNQGMGVNVDILDVPATTRTSGTLKGISMSANDFVVGGGLVCENDSVVISTDNAYVKKISVSEFGVLPRNRKGLKVLTFSKDNGTQIAFASVVKNVFEIMAVDKKGNNYSVNTDNIMSENRTTKGKIIDRNAKGAIIKNIYKYLWE